MLVSRSQPSFSSLMRCKATAFASASRSGNARNSDTQQRYTYKQLQLARFVVKLNNDILAKILERYFGAEAGAKFCRSRREVLQCRGDRVVCPQLGTSYPLAA